MARAAAAGRPAAIASAPEYYPPVKRPKAPPLELDKAAVGRPWRRPLSARSVVLELGAGGLELPVSRQSGNSAGFALRRHQMSQLELISCAPYPLARKGPNRCSRDDPLDGSRIHQRAASDSEDVFAACSCPLAHLVCRRAQRVQLGKRYIDVPAFRIRNAIGARSS